MQRWLGISLLIALAIAALTAAWWLTPLLRFLGAQDESVQNLSAFVQMVIWLGAALVFIVQLLQRRRHRAPSSNAPAVSSSHKKITVHGNDAQIVEVNAPVHGDIVKQQIVQTASPEHEREQRERAQRRYLERLQRFCQSLPLTAIGAKDGVEEKLELKDVYIDLDTETLIEDAGKGKARKEAALDPERDKKRLSALEAAAQTPRLALLGDPGSGKSTFVRRLLAWQVEAYLGKEAPLPGFTKELLPVLLVLRDLAPRLNQLALHRLSEERKREALAAALREQILQDLQRLEAEAFHETLLDALETGQCFLVLDGLDEVPYDLRKLIRSAVAGLLAQYRLRRVILTCRKRSYTGEAVLPNFTNHTLAPFDKEKIAQFVTGWYTARKNAGRYDAVQAADKTKDLTAAALDADLRELAENPMMLTTMALIHESETVLPKERVRLYHLAVDVLSQRWQKHKTGEGEAAFSKELLAFLKDVRRLRPVMERLAYEAHALRKGKRETADLDRGYALKLLEGQELLGSAALADEFLDYVDQRAGLLVGRGGDPPAKPVAYSFPHRSFQEYLAGCYVLSRRDYKRMLTELAHLGDYWARAAQLGAEHILFNSTSKGENDALDLAYNLFPPQPATQPVAQRLCLWSANIAALLGKETILRDVQEQAGPAYFAAVRPALERLLNSALTAPERAEAGVTLARLGDDRKEVTTLEHMEFCCVPKGPFYMGSAKDDKMAFDDEKVSNTDLLRQMDYDFWMARYPITNAQFEFFVQARGYEDARFWKEAIAAEVWNKGRVKGWRDEQTPRDRPYDFGLPFNLSNHPVVGVTWYEMLAFTRWLTIRGRKQGWLAPQAAIGLPSEAEWEKAARGGLQILAQREVRALGKKLEKANLRLVENDEAQRRYPWGNTIAANQCNYDETGVGKTSAVGCFAKGQSPYGCEEMSGNVWEWTRSLRGDYPYPDEAQKRKAREELSAPRNSARVLRGGAFPANDGHVRCADRNHYGPGYWDDYLGFRVAALPFTLDSVLSEL